MPLLADFPDFEFQFLRARERIEYVIAVGLREKIIDHAVADVLAVGAVIFPEYRPHRGPDLVDQLEILLRRQLRTDLDRVLQIRHQYRQRRQHRQAFAHQVANHHVALAEKIEQRRVILLRRNVDDEYPLPEKRGKHAPVLGGAGRVGQLDRKVEDGFFLRGDDRLVVELLRQEQRIPVQTMQQPEHTAFGQAVLGQGEVDAQQLGTEFVRLSGSGLGQQEEQIAPLAVRGQGIKTRENALARRIVVPGKLEVVIHHIGRMRNVLERKPWGAPVIHHIFLPPGAGSAFVLQDRRGLISGVRLSLRLGNSYACYDLGHAQALLFQSLDLLYPVYCFVGEIPHQIGITVLLLWLSKLRPGQYSNFNVIV